ncbi:MAG: hypothetical protein WAW59_07005 [Patescibacteria group bacterium]
MIVWSAVVDNIISLLPPSYELRDTLDRMLSVYIERDDSNSCCCLDTGSEGELLTEVAREVDSLHMTILTTERLYLLPCTVWGTIVDIDDLVVVSTTECTEYLVELIVYESDILFFSVCWEDERYEREIMRHR